MRELIRLISPNIKSELHFLSLQKPESNKTE